MLVHKYYINRVSLSQDYIPSKCFYAIFQCSAKQKERVVFVLTLKKFDLHQKSYLGNMLDECYLFSLFWYKKESPPQTVPRDKSKPCPNVSKMKVQINEKSNNTTSKI